MKIRTIGRNRFVQTGLNRLILVALNVAVAEAETTLAIRIQDRAVMLESDTVRFDEGEDISITWTGDERVELHLHGYDIAAVVEPGKPASMRFKGVVTGRFPVTSHGFGGEEHGHGHHALMYIEVYPK